MDSQGVDIVNNFYPYSAVLPVVIVIMTIPRPKWICDWENNKKKIVRSEHAWELSRVYLSLFYSNPSGMHYNTFERLVRAELEARHCTTI